jgi:hypothetical protein
MKEERGHGLLLGGTKSFISVHNSAVNNRLTQTSIHFTRYTALPLHPREHEEAIGAIKSDLSLGNAN